MEHLMPTQPTAASGASWIVHTAEDWERFAGPNWLSDIMTLSVTDRFHAKQGRSIGRWTLHNGSEIKTVYLKRHFVLPKHHARGAKLMPGRAWSPGLQEYEHLHWAKQAGIPVPKVAAVGERRGGPEGLQSFLAVEELAGMSALHEAIPAAARLLDAKSFADWKRTLFAEVARLTWELHRRGAYHQDLYLCHFYIRDADCERPPTNWLNNVAMIDFHRMKRTRLLGAWYQAKDLGQLLFSTEGVVGLGDDDRRMLLDPYRDHRGRNDTQPWCWLEAAAKKRAATNLATQRRRANGGDK